MRKKLPVKFTKLSPFDYNHELGIKILAKKIEILIQVLQVC